MATDHPGDPAGTMTPAEAMIARDRASAQLGMEVLHGEPGHAVVAMTVREDMLNGHAVLHGGFIFALADTTFAIACNETAEVTLAIGADISFLRSATVGQRLTATAQRRVRQGRSGLYDVQVLNEADEVVAEFRGRSLTTARPVR